MYLRKVSGTMYKVAKILAIIALVIAAFALIAGISMIGNKVEIANKPDIPAPYAGNPEKVAELGGSVIGYAIVTAALATVQLIMANKARKALLAEGPINQKQHVIMCVLGALLFGIFCLLGGIFALIASVKEEEVKPVE